MDKVVEYYGTSGGDSLLPGESLHTFNLSGYPAASGAYLRNITGGRTAVMDIIPVLVAGKVILIEGVCTPAEWSRQKPVLEAMLQSLAITPTDLLALPPGYAGKWLDPDTTGTVTTIELQGSAYVVVSVINPNRGGNELTKTNWSNGVLTWTYCIPGGNCLTSVTTGLEGDLLHSTWTDDRGRSGTTTFQRQP